LTISDELPQQYLNQSSASVSVCAVASTQKADSLDLHSKTV